MSGLEDREHAPPLGALLLYKCRRCGATVTKPAADPATSLQAAIDSGRTLIVHRCADDAQGVASLAGSAPGRAFTCTTVAGAAPDDAPSPTSRGVRGGW